MCTDIWKIWSFCWLDVTYPPGFAECWLCSRKNERLFRVGSTLCNTSFLFRIWKLETLVSIERSRLTILFSNLNPKTTVDSKVLPFSRVFVRREATKKWGESGECQLLNYFGLVLRVNVHPSSSQPGSAWLHLLIASRNYKLSRLYDQVMRRQMVYETFPSNAPSRIAYVKHSISHSTHFSTNNKKCQLKTKSACMHSTS